MDTAWPCKGNLNHITEDYCLFLLKYFDFIRPTISKNRHFVLLFNLIWMFICINFFTYSRIAYLSKSYLQWIDFCWIIPRIIFPLFSSYIDWFQNPVSSRNCLLLCYALTKDPIVALQRALLCSLLCGFFFSFYCHFSPNNFRSLLLNVKYLGIVDGCL